MADIKKLENKNGRYFQGFFKPNNPDKYMGDPNNIVYRSGYEFKYMRELDSDPDVVEWGSEEFFIPYRSPIDNRWHRYFVDFIVKKKINGRVRTFIVEIKPKAQTEPPKRPKKKNDKKYIREVMTYAVNQAKWEAAREFCADKKFEFVILTEKELKIK